MSFTKVYVLLFFIITPKLSNFDTATEKKMPQNGYITHFNGLESYLLNRLKKKSLTKGYACQCFHYNAQIR